MEQDKKEKHLFLLMCAVTALIPIMYVTVRNGGFYHISDDFDNQMLPFLFNFRDAFENGLNTYMWNFDLGTPMLYAYGYYGIGSIFYYPVFLVSRKFLPYIIGVIFFLKYLTACYTAYFFIKRHTKTSFAAMAGAILYAFSGLQCTNLSFYCFHDITAVFPLMLAGCDGIIDEREPAKRCRKGIFFALAVFINCVTNYVFFIQSVVAVVIYFVFRVSWRHRETYLKAAGCILFGTLGVGLSGIIFIPSIRYIMDNERASAGLSEVMYLYDFKHILYILKGLLLPGDAMLDETCLMFHEWSSTNAFLPLVGILCVIAYILHNRDYLSRLTCFLVLISFIPAGNGAFLLFTIVYHRWWYFLVLIMALESVLVLENRQKYSFKVPALIETLLVAFLGISVCLVREDGESLLYHPVRFILEIVFTILSMLVTIAVMKIRDDRKYRATLFGGIILSSILTFIYAEKLYIDASPVSHDEFKNTYTASMQFPEIPDSYRYRNYTNTMIMFAAGKNVTGLGSYSSTTSSSVIEFDELFDHWDVSRRMNKNFIPGLPEFLGGRYLVMSENKVEERYPDAVLDKLPDPYLSFDVYGKEWNIYELEACPIGFEADKVISESELRTLPVEQRGIALLYAAVIPDELVNELGIDSATAEDVTRLIEEDKEHVEKNALFDNRAISSLVAQNTARSVKNFQKSSRGFSAGISLSDDGYVLFTIPYDEGWDVEIDGERADVYDSGGMMLIAVPKGEHEISATYHIPALFVAVAVSVISLIIILALFILTDGDRREKNKVMICALFAALFGIALVQYLDAGSHKAALNNTDVLISEVCAHNVHAAYDDNGEYGADYIEIYNPTNKTINLKGYGLSDDKRSLMKYVFGDISVEPGEAVIAWCSDNKDDVSKYSEGYVPVDVHGLGFKISNGEACLLTDPYGKILSYVPVPGDLSDDEVLAVSYSDLKTYTITYPSPYYVERRHTPRKNIVLSDPVFSADGGWFSKDIEVELTSKEGVIHYTLDGTDPDEESSVYDGPIKITDRSSEKNVYSAIDGISNDNRYLPDYEVDKGTVIKAICISDKGVSNVVTRTFFVGLDEDLYRDMPIISLTVSPEDFFDYYKGIYMIGNVYDRYTAKYDKDDRERDFSYYHANYAMEGRGWERRAQIEYFDENHNAAYDKSLGIRIHGGWSVALNQKSFNIYSRQEYDGQQYFGYDFLDNGYSYDSLCLRSGGGGEDLYVTKMRDVFHQSLLENRAVGTQKGVPCVLFLNGEYWGLYNIQERVSENYVSIHYGVDPENVAILKKSYGKYDTDEENSGFLAQYLDILKFTEENDLSDGENYEYIKKVIDVRSAADYYAAEIFLGNSDAYYNNVALWRCRKETDSEYGDGRWRWLLYDLDDTASLDEGMNTADVDSFLYGNWWTDTGPLVDDRLFASLIKNDEFKKLFVESMMDMINNNFRYEDVSGKLWEMAEKYRVQDIQSQARFRGEHELENYPDIEDYEPPFDDLDFGEAVGLIDGFYRERPEFIIKYMIDDLDSGGDVADLVDELKEG